MKLSIKVITNTKKNEITDDNIDLLGMRCIKIKVNQPPEDGRANKAVIEVLAEYLKIKKSQIKIVSGESSRSKVVKVEL